MPKYSGSCHCGTVTYEIKTEVNFGAVCDCTICKRKGAVMGFAEPEDFNLLSGEEALTLCDSIQKLRSIIFAKNVVFTLTITNALMEK